MAWDAPTGPTMSKAMGPRREMKQPSNNPMINTMTMKNAMWLQAVSSMVKMPMQKKEI